MSEGNGKPAITLVGVPPSSVLFNELMRHYGNPTRAHPLKSLSATMVEACTAAGLDVKQMCKDHEAAQPSRIIQS